MVRPERVELPTYWFVASGSIDLGENLHKPKRTKLPGRRPFIY